MNLSMNNKTISRSLWDSDEEENGKVESILPHSNIDQSNKQDYETCSKAKMMDKRTGVNISHDNFLTCNGMNTGSSHQTANISMLDDYFGAELTKPDTLFPDEDTKTEEDANDINYKDLYLREKEKCDRLQREVKFLEHRLEQLQSRSINTISEMYDEMNISNTKEDVRDDHWDEMVEKEKRRKLKIRSMKLSNNSTVKRSANLRSGFVQSSISQTISGESKRLNDDVVEDTKYQSSGSLASLVSSEDLTSAKIDVAPSHLDGNDIHNDHGKTGRKVSRMSLRRASASSGKPSQKIAHEPLASSVQRPPEPILISDTKSQFNQQPSYISKNNPTTKNNSGFSSSSDDDDDDSDWDSQEEILEENNQHNKISKPSANNQKHISVRDDWDDDSTADEDNSAKSINLDESAIEAQVLSWARSRVNIIHMFTSIHEVYPGKLPEFESGWAEGRVMITQSTEIRKMYL